MGWRETPWTRAERAHNPEVAGSNPAPATNSEESADPGQRPRVSGFFFFGPASRSRSRGDWSGLQPEQRLGQRARGDVRAGGCIGEQLLGSDDIDGTVGSRRGDRPVQQAFLPQPTGLDAR